MFILTDILRTKKIEPRNIYCANVLRIKLQRVTNIPTQLYFELVQYEMGERARAMPIKSHLAIMNSSSHYAPYPHIKLSLMKKLHNRELHYTRGWLLQISGSTSHISNILQETYIYVKY